MYHPYSPETFKQQFPLWKAHPELIYLDTAATAQKPSSVIEAMSEFMASQYATVHRAAYALSYQATACFENSRKKIAQYIGADSEHLIFTKGTTEALNLLSVGFEALIRPHDEILVVETEHHANLLPWQQLAKKTGANLIRVPVLDSGHVDLSHLATLINARSRILACAHMSNVTGVIQPLEQIVEMIHSVGGYCLVDGAQGVCHEKIDVAALKVDAYAFSGHKLYGPTGVGALYVQQDLLARLGLYQVGGDVIETVSFEKTHYRAGRGRFEAGTPMITEVIGLSAAVEFLQKWDFEAIGLHERKLGERIKEKLRQTRGIHLLGESDSGLVSFYSETVHALDLATYLDSRHIAVRSGHLCAQPALARYKVKQVVRISTGAYTTCEDIDIALNALHEALVFFS